MTTQMDDIMGRLARIKTLAENAGTPGEAAAASAMLSKLLMKHNLSKSDIVDVTDQDSQEYGKFDFDLGSSLSWRKILIQTLADTTFCYTVFNHKGSHVNIIGQDHNVTVVKAMYEYLTSAIDRLADQGWKEVDSYEKQFVSGRAWKNAHRMGSTRTIRDRLREIYQENLAQQKASGDIDSNALVAVRDDLKNAVARYFPRLRSVSTNGRVSSGSGLAAGREAGRGVGLEKQVGRGRVSATKALVG